MTALITTNQRLLSKCLTWTICFGKKSDKSRDGKKNTRNAYTIGENHCSADLSTRAAIALKKAVAKVHCTPGSDSFPNFLSGCHIRRLTPMKMIKVPKMRPEVIASPSKIIPKINPHTSFVCPSGSLREISVAFRATAWDIEIIVQSKLPVISKVHAVNPVGKENSNNTNGRKISVATTLLSHAKA